MKKLYFLDEAEKKRILMLHESATKKQYLKESDSDVETEINEKVDMGQLVTYAWAGGLGGAALALLQSSNGSMNGVYKMFQACKATGMGKSTMSGGMLDEIADSLFTALDGMGTDENGIKTALSKIQTIPDLCAVSKRYAENHPGASLWNDLDGDIDNDSEWNAYVYRPLLNAVRKTQEISAKAAEQAKQKAAQDKELGPKAAQCGWVLKKPDGSTVPDVAGYRASNWKCPKTDKPTKKTNTSSAKPSSPKPSSPGGINYADYGI